MDRSAHQEANDQRYHQNAQLPLADQQYDHSNYSSAYSTPALSNQTASLAISSPPSASDTRTRNPMDYSGDMDGDMHMEDADPFNKQKYARPPQQSTSRPTSQYLPAEQADATSRAAARYSPMHTSPTTSYVSSTPSQNQFYTPQQSARQSPSRHNPYASPPPAGQVLRFTPRLGTRAVVTAAAAAVE